MNFNIGNYISVKYELGHILGCIILGIVINLSLGLKVFGVAILGSIAIAILCSVILLLHEIGHTILSVKKGIQSNIVMTFLGGYAMIHEEDLRQRRISLLNGPMFSMACSLILAVIASTFSSYFAVIVVMLGIGLNLMNLIPLYPLDGGMIVATTIMINNIDARYFFVSQAITLILMWGVSLYFANFLFPLAMTIVFITSIFQKVLVTNE